MAQDSPPIGSHAELHARLLEGDELAARDLVIELQPLLERSLRRSSKATPRDAIVDAVVDALVDFVRRPDRFDPSRGVPLRACEARRRPEPSGHAAPSVAAPRP